VTDPEYIYSESPMQDRYDARLALGPDEPEAESPDYDECAECGHVRHVHWSGSCHHVTAGLYDCNCEGFVEKEDAA
jgi:hypothetical protein